jgi:ribosome-binding ATPase YchF (GTP1/OBG family)
MELGGGAAAAASSRSAVAIRATLRPTPVITDFKRGFIRAETIAYDDYVKGGSEAGAREAGKLRLEARD